MSIPKLKDLLNERYVSKRSDTIEDVYQSAVDSLEDLSDLIKKHAPEERLLSRTLEKQSMMIRRMITKSKSYQDIKDMTNDETKRFNSRNRLSFNKTTKKCCRCGSRI